MGQISFLEGRADLMVDGPTNREAAAAKVSPSDARSRVWESRGAVKNPNNPHPNLAIIKKKSGQQFLTEDPGHLSGEHNEAGHANATHNARPR